MKGQSRGAHLYILTIKPNARLLASIDKIDGEGVDLQYNGRKRHCLPNDAPRVSPQRYNLLGACTRGHGERFLFEDTMSWIKIRRMPLHSIRWMPHNLHGSEARYDSGTCWWISWRIKDLSCETLTCMLPWYHLDCRYQLAMPYPHFAWCCHQCCSSSNTCTGVRSCRFPWWWGKFLFWY